jgi:hypothetical protein
MLKPSLGGLSDMLLRQGYAGKTSTIITLIGLL